ncbi:MAG: protein translocase subunit SecD [Ilumatobacter sp.]|nr:protein translocase subunit SecD [Ilumatobacter sp.]
MRRRLWFSLVGTVIVAVGALVFNIGTDNTPILGLDLQGGVSVILAPEEGASGDDLTVVRDLVRTSLERRGVAEPDVRVQGSNVVVDLPGVKDQQQALDSVSVSGIVTLRPVLDFSNCSIQPTDPIVTSDDTGTGDETVPSDESGEAQPAGFRRAPVDSSPDDSVPPPADPADTTPDEVPDGTPADPPADLVPLPQGTPGAEFLPTLDGGALCLGAVQPGATGEVFARDSASTVLQDGWGVTVDLRGDGEIAWNSLATQCFNRQPTCPSTGLDFNGSARPGQIAIVLDDVIQSAPVVNTPVFDGAVSITGNFSETEARQLTDVLNRGAFPVQVTPQEARTVSASAGSDSLKAAIVAGLIGMGLVLTFLIFYYRWMALVIVSGLVVWAMTVFSAASFVSGWTNYALSLAGVTGIIVAIGVTVDSYVVFFERMKDEIRNGRTLRNAAPRSFTSTWRTIWSADLVSVLGALILFSLSVGSVRGFALYLGITTLCDLIVCYLFTRPAVLLISRSKFMVGRRAFGLEVAS